MTREQLAALALSCQQSCAERGWSPALTDALLKVCLGFDPEAKDREIFETLEASGIGFDAEAAMAADDQVEDEPERIEAVGGNGSFELRADPFPSLREMPELQKWIETREPMNREERYAAQNEAAFERSTQWGPWASAYLGNRSPDQLSREIDEEEMTGFLGSIDSGGG